MELNVLDRLILLNVLPKEGDITTLKIVRQLREDLSFSEDELKALNFVQEEGNIRWAANADPLKDCKFGEKATDLIVETLKKLNSDKKLTENHMSLYEKFIKE